MNGTTVPTDRFHVTIIASSSGATTVSLSTDLSASNVASAFHVSRS